MVWGKLSDSPRLPHLQNGGPSGASVRDACKDLGRLHMESSPLYGKPSRNVCYYYGQDCCAVAFVVVVLVVIIVIVVIVIWPLPASPHYFLCQFLSLNASPRLKEATPRPLHVLKGSLPSFCCHCCEGAEEPLEGMS